MGAFATLTGPVGAVLLSAALVYAGNGLQGVVVPLRGVAEGFPTTVLGLFGSAFSLGFMGGCLAGPRVVRRVGHIRALAVFAALAASTALLYPLMPDPLPWVALRMAGGAALAGMFLVIESWLNERATNADRGRIFGAYMVVNYAAVTAGQLLAAAGDPKGFALFAVAAIGISWALIPIGLTTAPAPQPVPAARLRVLRLFSVSPVGAVGSVIIGITSGAFGTLAAVFGARLGFTTLEIAVFLGASIVGAAAMQVPAGWLSDRMDRRRIIVALGGLSAALGLWMAVSGRMGLAEAGAAAIGVGLPEAWIVAAFLYGCASYPLYGLLVAHMNDFVAEDAFVETASGTLFLWGAGAVIGPVVVGAAMTATDPYALFFGTAIGHAALTGFTLWRMTRRAAPSAEAKTDYVPVAIAGTTPAVADLDPRSEPSPEAPAPEAPAPETPAEGSPAPGNPGSGP